MTNQSVGFCFLKSKCSWIKFWKCSNSKAGISCVFHHEFLLGLDAGGARHVLPDPARLPSSHQGQKIHRLLLGTPCPGSPPGTARYLPKKQPLAPQPPQHSSHSSPLRPGSNRQCPEKCHRSSVSRGRFPVLGLHLHKAPVAPHCSQCHCSGPARQ